MLYHPKEKYQLIKQKRKLTKFRLEEDKPKSKEGLGNFNMRAYSSFVRSQKWNTTNSLLTPTPMELVTAIKQLMVQFKSFDKIKEISAALYRKYTEKKAQIHNPTENTIIIDNTTAVSNSTTSSKRQKCELSDDLKKKIAHIFIVKGSGFSNFRQYFDEVNERVKIQNKQYRKEEISLSETILRRIENLITQQTEEIVAFSRTQLKQGVEIVLNKNNDMPSYILKVVHQFIRNLYNFPNGNEPTIKDTIELYNFVKENMKKKSGQ